METPEVIELGSVHPAICQSAVRTDAVVLRNWGVLGEYELPSILVASADLLDPGDDWDGWPVEVDKSLEADTVEYFGSSGPRVRYRLSLDPAEEKELSARGRDLSLRYSKYLEAAGTLRYPRI